MEKYTYAAAYVRALENNMFSDEQLMQAVRADSISDIERLMAAKDYSGDDAFDMLDSEMSRVWETCFELCPDEEQLSVLILENDFHNIKAVLKSVAAASDWEELISEPYTVSPESIANAFKNNDYSGLTDELAAVCRDAYSALTQNGDAQYAEIFLDRMQYEIMAKSCPDGFLKGYIERLILVADIKIFLRAEGKSQEFLREALITSTLIDKNALLQTNSAKEEVLKKQGYAAAYSAFTESLGAFDKWCDDLVSEYMKEAGFSFFGFDAVIAFIIAKKTEIKNLRTIIYGKLNDMPEAEIAERLRAVYV